MENTAEDADYAEDAEEEAVCRRILAGTPFTRWVSAIFQAMPNANSLSSASSASSAAISIVVFR
jgi:hypothetical protein